MGLDLPESDDEDDDVSLYRSLPVFTANTESQREFAN